jgi:hypothetical protein
MREQMRRIGHRQTDFFDFLLKIWALVPNKSVRIRSPVVSPFSKAGFNI